MLDVIFTVDCELSARRHTGPEDIRANIDRAMFGRTPGGEFGIGYQARTLAEHGLTGVFFIEALATQVVGEDYLAEAVAAVRDAGQEVQLHLHAEWLSQMADPERPAGHRRNMADCSLAEQAWVIDRGLAALKRAGAHGVNAFRAGNYGANRDTLRALAGAGIAFDSSYNAAYLDGDCGIAVDETLIGPTALEGVTEVPVSFFRDYPGHIRHTQLCACSFAELVHALEQAEAKGHPTFVIVSHSFELLNRSKTKANRIVLRRFRKLCRFLQDNPARFRTTGFRGLEQSPLPTQRTALASSLWRTGMRMAEQAVGKILYDLR